MVGLFFRATVFIIVLFKAGGSIAAGKSVTSNAEHGKVRVAEVIAEAKDLILEGKKVQALSVMRDFYHKNQAASSDGANLTVEFFTAWTDIANLFLKDKSQSIFSSAEAVWMNDPKQGLSLLKPLLASEPGNFQIVLLAARAAIRSYDCSSALAYAIEAENFLEVAPESRLINLQASVCGLKEPGALGLNEMPEPIMGFASALASKTKMQGWAGVEPAAYAAYIEGLVKTGRTEQARVVVASWESRYKGKQTALAKSDPEIWYWKWRLSRYMDVKRADEAEAPNAGAPDLLAARNYLRICNELTTRRRKELSIYPDLCLRTDAVEADLKKGEKRE